jgi:hypothetical protein
MTEVFRHPGPYECGGREYESAGLFLKGDEGYVYGWRGVCELCGRTFLFSTRGRKLRIAPRRCDIHQRPMVN